MSTIRKILCTRPWVLVWVLLMGLPSMAWAITPKDEDEIAREFMRVAKQRLTFIDDPMVVDYVNRVGKKLLSVMPPQPFNYRFYVIRSDVYNAFAIPAGRVFINSGLLAAMDNEDELAGILGHEIAHVTARHISDRIERQKKMSWATLAGLVAGAFIGGGTGVGAAVTQGTLAAATAVSLAYSREDERQADQLGLLYLDQAGYSARGLLSVMEKIRSKEWYNTADFPDYLSTHPGSRERLVTIGSWIEQNPDRPAAGPPKYTRGFAMVKARLMAVYGDEDAALRYFSEAAENNPNDPVAFYGLGLALARKGNLDGAAAGLRKALERDPFDPHILNEMGRVYFLAGRYPEAVDSLQGAVSLSPDNLEGLSLLGQTYMELGELDAAVASLEGLVNLKPDFPKASFYLGNAYGKLGRMDMAHYHLGLHYRNEGDEKTALFHLERALTLSADPRAGEKIREAIQEVEQEQKKAKKNSG